LQANLYDLEHEVFMKKIPVMIVFEGWAAAGKGSTINALAERLDPRGSEWCRCRRHARRRLATRGCTASG